LIETALRLSELSYGLLQQIDNRPCTWLNEAG